MIHLRTRTIVQVWMRGLRHEGVRQSLIFFLRGSSYLVLMTFKVALEEVRIGERHGSVNINAHPSYSSEK